MNTLLHLCKKDFTFAKPWILGTWLTFAISNVLLWINPEGEASTPFMMFRLLAPAVMVFLTSSRIIHCDPFVGTSGFMGTRPVRAATLLRNKLILIALVLVLPAVGFAMLHAVCLRVRLPASDYLLLFIETSLVFSLIAGAAVAFSVISRNVGIMVVIIGFTLFGLLLYMAFGGPHHRLSGSSMEDKHLRASIWLVAQALLPAAMLAVSISWVTKRRVGLTAAVFLLGAGILISLVKLWNWNFVNTLSNDATEAELFSGTPAIQWMDPPRFGSNRTRESIRYSQVDRVGRLTGLKNDWTGKLVKFQSEARFADGTVWKSAGDSGLYAFDYIAPIILPRLGIQVPEDHPMRLYDKAWSWTLFECEKSRLMELPDRRASIRGTGNFQLYQPVILAELPARAGASVVVGHFKYRIDSLHAFEDQIDVHLNIQGVVLSSRGENARASLSMECLFVNSGTKQFTNTGASGGSSSTGNALINLHKTVWLDDQLDPAVKPKAGEFLKGARLYILGTRYGGNIELPFEIPEMLLEEKR